MPLATGADTPWVGDSDDVQEDIRDPEDEGNRGGRNPQVDVERE